MFWALSRGFREQSWAIHHLAAIRYDARGNVHACALVSRPCRLAGLPPRPHEPDPLDPLQTVTFGYPGSWARPRCTASRWPCSWPSRRMAWRRPERRRTARWRWCSCHLRPPCRSWHPTQTRSWPPSSGRRCPQRLRCPSRCRLPWSRLRPRTRALRLQQMPCPGRRPAPLPQARRPRRRPPRPR